MGFSTLIISIEKPVNFIHFKSLRSIEKIIAGIALTCSAEQLLGCLLQGASVSKLEVAA